MLFRVVQHYVWQEVEIEKTLTVSKAALGDEDLGLYVAEELGEVIDYELAYLKEVQQLEKEKGLTQKIVTTQYAGLIGRFLSPQEKVFEGYQPVVQPPEEVVSQPQIVGEYNPPQSTVPTEQPTTEQLTTGQPIIQQMPVDRELIRQIVQEMLAEQQGQTTSSVSESTPTSSQTPVPTQEITPVSEPETPTSTTATSTPETVTSTPESATSTDETATSTEATSTATTTESVVEPIEPSTTTEATTTEPATSTEEPAT